jgi:hypothetical protein
MRKAATRALVGLGRASQRVARREATGTTVPRLVPHDAISQSIGDRLEIVDIAST